MSAWRLLLLAFSFGLAILEFEVQAQQPGKVPVVGVLMASAGPNDPVLEALRRGLHDLGYDEARNIKIEYRLARGELDRLPRLAEELVTLKVDAIVVGTEPAARAASKATATIPIVMVAYTFDPVASGLIDSVSRAGANLTDVSARAPELVGKRLELLKEAILGLSRVAVLWDSLGRKEVDELKPAARALGIQLELLALEPPYDFKTAFRTARKKRAGAVMALTSTAFYVQRAQIAGQALENRLSVTGYAHELTRAGGLISYGPDLPDSFYRVGYFIDRLVKGAKPSDLPIEETASFKLVVNLKTAKALGITIPESILQRADEVIR